MVSGLRNEEMVICPHKRIFVDNHTRPVIVDMELYIAKTDLCKYFLTAYGFLLATAQLVGRILQVLTYP